MFRLFLFIWVLIVSLTIHGEVDAANSYTPGAMIALTGSNSSVRFDVANDLIGFDATIPTLITGTQRFSGAFYGTGIGWIEFSTGSYQVWLDCGGQYLSGLTMNCTLTGTGWSENVWDIYFNSGTTVIYNPNTGYLSGSAISFVWEIDLSGIILPLRPVAINESTTLIANHNVTLSVSGAWLYDSGIKPWEITITPISSPVGAPIAWVHGVFTPSDLSLATTYDVVITDTNMSKTQFSLIVTPWAPTTTLVPGSHYANTFCLANSGDTSRCPDGVNRIESTHSLTWVVGPVIGNWTDKYTYITKIRDGYGNRITHGEIKIKYITKVKNKQTVLWEHNSHLPSMDGDAIVGVFANIFWEDTKIFLLSSDPTYTIASTAPTNTTDNIIQLDSIKYLSWGIESSLVPTGTALNFLPLFTASTSSPNPPIVWVPNLFLTTVTQYSPTAIVPTILATLKIWTGDSADWRTLSSSPVAICTNYPLDAGSNNLCDWNDSYVSSIATSTGTSFTFTGTYTTWALFTVSEPTVLKNYIYYQSGGTEILYSMPPKIIRDATLGIERIRVFGQSSESIGIWSQNRVNIINGLRE